MAFSTEAISTLIAEQGVAALISDELVIPIADKSYSKVFGDKTYQSGTTIKIRREDQPLMPIQSNVIQMDPVVQGEISLPVLQWNDGLPTSDIEELYNLGGEELIKERITRPRMKNLAVQAAVNCYTTIGQCSGYFGTAGTDLTTSATWGAGQALLNNQLAMDDGLFAFCSPDTMNATAASLAAAFNPSTDSAAAYLNGKVKEASNINFFATSNIPNHTNGSAVGNGTSGMVVATNVTTGATTIAVSGGTANGVITAGSIIFFKGRYAVQPNTKKVLGTPRHFTVASAVTLDGSGVGTITVTEAIYGPENPKLQNISVLPVITTDFVGLRGTASKVYEQAIVVKKKSFAFVSLPMPGLKALENAFEEKDGVRIRVCSFGDGTNSINMTRWDMLIGSVILQPRHICRAFVRDVT